MKVTEANKETFPNTVNCF